MHLSLHKWQQRQITLHLSLCLLWKMLLRKWKLPLLHLP